MMFWVYLDTSDTRITTTFDFLTITRPRKDSSVVQLTQWHCSILALRKIWCEHVPLTIAEDLRVTEMQIVQVRYPLSLLRERLLA